MGITFGQLRAWAERGLNDSSKPVHIGQPSFGRHFCDYQIDSYSAMIDCPVALKLRPYEVKKYNICQACYDLVHIVNWSCQQLADAINKYPEDQVLSAIKAEFGFLNKVKDHKETCYPFEFNERCEHGGWLLKNDGKVTEYDLIQIYLRLRNPKVWP